VTNTKPPQLLIPDLGAIRARKQAEAQQAANTVEIDTVPNSCLYELFRTDSVQALARAAQLVNAITSGQVAQAALSKGVDPGIEVQNAMIAIEFNNALGQQRATLALAAATMAMHDNDRPKWFDNGQLSDFAQDYFAKRQQASPTGLPTVE